jgi:acetylornithine deacetylase/succinyl-diaminopimelate desuccinylase-like protein
MVATRRSLLTCALIAAALLLTAVPALAQRALPQALADPRVDAALADLDARRDTIAAWLAAIGSIVSPSGQEQARAEAVAAEMRRVGLQHVVVDEAPNAVGVIPGRSGRALVFVSTLDDLATVADHQRAASMPARVEGDRVVGPGTNTSLTTAAMVAAAAALVARGVQPEHDLVFAAVAQEETGLVGMKALHTRYRDRAIAFVDVLGDGSTITYGAMTIHWWRVVASGPPGHSLGGGLPNVNQGIGRAVDRILGLPHPERHRDTRTVVNVARLESGAVFNHKPATGWFSLDIRSLDATVVGEVEGVVREVLDRVTAETGITFAMEPEQLTPGGQIPGFEASPLVTAAAAIARHLGVDGRLGNAGSSNMNVALGAGTPAIGLGGSRGGRRGFADEWADIPALMRTARHVLLLAATMGF